LSRFRPGARFLRGTRSIGIGEDTTMGQAIKATAAREADGCVVQLWVEDPDLVGKQGTLKIELHAKVKRSSPVHAQRVLAERSFTLAAGLNRLPVGDVLGDAFLYRGAQLDLEPIARIEIDDGVIFDTKLEVDLHAVCALPARADVPDHKGVHSPRDRFNFIANLRAIPAKARMIVIWLMLIGIPVVLLNAVVGARDQMVPESQVWFYDHSGDDGSESPLMKALMGSGGIGLVLWLAIRRQLQQYMKFEARLPPEKQLSRDARCRASDIIEGRARVALEQAIVRVVAYNREHGQYRATEGSGKNKRTVTKSFTEPSRGVVLYEQLLAHVPANMPLAGYLDGDIEFAKMFDALYPPSMLDSTHGLSLQLEAQLLHPEYVDQDVEMPAGQVSVAEFYGRA
jgi:hypothetical protein